jgi:hypothetical protein
MKKLIGALLVSVLASYPAIAQVVPAVYDGVVGKNVGDSGGIAVDTYAETAAAPTGVLNFPVTVPAVNGGPPLGSPPVNPGAPGQLIDPSGGFSGVSGNVLGNGGKPFVLPGQAVGSPVPLGGPEGPYTFVFGPVAATGYGGASGTMALTGQGIQFSGLTLVDNNLVGNGNNSVLIAEAYMDFRNVGAAQVVALIDAISLRITLNAVGAQAAIGMDSVAQVGTLAGGIDPTKANVGINFVVTPGRTYYLPQVVGAFDGFGAANGGLANVAQNGAFQGAGNVATFAGGAAGPAVLVPAGGTLRIYDTVTLYGDPMSVDNVNADFDIQVPEPSSAVLVLFGTVVWALCGRRTRSSKTRS